MAAFSSEAAKHKDWEFIEIYYDIVSGTKKEKRPDRERNGHPSQRKSQGRRQKAICYVSNWYTGLAVLAAWNAGIYEPGMEERIQERLQITPEKTVTTEGRITLLCQQLMQMTAHEEAKQKGVTIAEAFEMYYRSKYGELAPHKLSQSAGKHARTAFGKLSAIAERPLDGFTVDELQRIVNGIGLKESSVKAVLTVLKGMYQYAMSRELCTRNPAQYLKMPDCPPSVHYEPFTDAELEILWRHADDPMARVVIVMCYSGYRYSAYATLETDLEEGYFRGGIKTDAGKHRIVPIHSGIRELVDLVLKTEGGFSLGFSQYAFIRRMEKKMTELGIDVEGRHHSPHSCRHTFSRLCETYGVREADRKRMMGHAFKGDITNGVYGHRTLEELRAEIEKIQIPER